MSELTSKNKSTLFELSNCSKCGHNNPPYLSICENCKSYLRDKVVNIDLWSTIYKLIESPSEAFKNILFSEHKNFIFFLLFILSIKNLILIRFISVPVLGTDGVSTSLILQIVLSILITGIILSLISIIQSKLFIKYKINFRVIDVLSLNLYTQIPLVFSLIFIFPVELIVLGSDIFSNNPFAFQIKPAITYILIFLELVMIIWSFILYYLSVQFAGISKIKSFYYTSLFLLLWVSVLFASSKIIFVL